jgi:superoxide dismutase, Fe-Mn family
VRATRAFYLYAARVLLVSDPVRCVLLLRFAHISLETIMSFTLKPLPFDPSSLEPVMSARTLEFHHGKHHAGYVQKLNELTENIPLAEKDLESIIRSTAKQSKQRAIYNNAAQVWNHDFFWDSLKPQGGEPSGLAKDRIVATFDSMENFTKHFVEAAVAQFGSGWAWLVAREGKLEIVATPDADSPLTTDAYPLLTCDVWEHAYYLDYQDRRADFVKAVLEKCINWDHVAKQLEKSDAEKSAGKRRAAS